MLRFSLLEAEAHSKSWAWYVLPAQLFQAVNINYFLDTGLHTHVLQLDFFSFSYKWKTLTQKSDIGLVAFWARLRARGQGLSTLVIVESITRHLVSELAVQSVLVEGRNRVDRCDDPKARWLKTVCFCLVGSSLSFLGVTSYKPIVIIDISPIQWSEQTAIEQWEGSQSLGGFPKDGASVPGFDG